jgi:hypothetical protein
MNNKNKENIFFTRAEEIINISQALIVKYNKIRHEASMAQLVMMFLFAKSRVSAKALLLLLNNGYKYDARAILRSIFENIINMEYIFRQSDQELCAQRYIGYEIVSSLKYADKYLKYGKDKTQLPQIRLRIKELEKELQNLKTKHGKDFGKTSHWTGYSIKCVAEICQMEYYYEILYSMWSDFTHANIPSSRNYTEEINGELRIVEKLDYNCKPELIALIDFFIRICNRFNNELRLEMNKEIEDFKNRHLELTKEDQSS